MPAPAATTPNSNDHAPSRRRNWGRWFEPAFEVLGHFVFGIPLLGKLFEILWALAWRTPRNCTRRIDLYRIGEKMVRRANRRITVVSTAWEEDFPFKPGEPDDSERAIRNYFLTLHRVARRNRVGRPRHLVQLTRGVDLRDQDKCLEAMSLLYYGAGVEIINTQLPLEFLMRDRSWLLVGFPADKLLIGGFHSYSRSQCAALARWLEACRLRDGSAICRSPAEVARISATITPSHSLDCLCHAVSILPPDPAKHCADTFDRIAEWYELLYADVEPRLYYAALADFLLANTRSNRTRMLDCGCGPAFGASILAGQGIEYWGVDASGRMLEGVTQAPGCRYVHEDFVPLLMDAGQGRSPLPKRFNVIACQGNTLDFMLGAIEKTLALALFNEALEPGGILLVSGEPFTVGQADADRSLRTRLGQIDLKYNFQWAGNYAAMTITSSQRPESKETLFLHPLNHDWLDGVLRRMGFSRIDHTLPWYGPSGGQPYYLLAYQKGPHRH